MRPHAAVREISRDVRTGTARVGGLFLIAAFVLSVVVLSDILTISRSVNDAIDYQQSGAAITTLALPGRINGASCEALADAPNVSGAGAVRSLGKIPAVTLPSEPLELYSVTPGFAEVLGADDHRGDGVYVSADVASAFGGSAIPLGAGAPAPIRGAFPYPPDGRRAGFGWAVASPTSADQGPFDECWVLAWPQRPDMRQLLLTSVTVVHGGDGSADQPVVSPLNATYGLTFPGPAAYQSRVTQYAPALGAMVGVLLAAGAVWFRRVEIASNLHAGGTRGALCLQHLVECAIWSAPAVAGAWLAGFFSAGFFTPTELPSLALRSAEIALPFFAGSLAGTSLAFTVVREKRLWLYAKSR